MSQQTLILGWGNPGRGDDGLGPEFVRRIADSNISGVVTDSDYQLQVEDAAEITDYERVLFVDADRSGPEPFGLARVYPEGRLAFSTHSLSPAAVLMLARDLFQSEPEAWILGIRGYQFDEFCERLSSRSRSNLDQAVQFLQTALLAGNLVEVGEGETGIQKTSVHLGELCQTTSL